MTDLKTRFYEHPLIRATYKTGLIRGTRRKQLPSYISPSIVCARGSSTPSTPA